MGYLKSKTDPLFRDFSVTPDDIVAWAARRYGCGADLAARRENKRLPFYFSDIVDEYDPECFGDGLLSEWRTPFRAEIQCGWLNPPYSNPTPWLEKAANEATNGFTTVALLPALNGEKWGRWVFFAREIIFIIGRISFLDFQTYQPMRGNNRGSMLVIFGPHSQRQPSVSFINREELK